MWLEKGDLCTPEICSVGVCDLTGVGNDLNGVRSCGDLKLPLTRDTREPCLTEKSNVTPWNDHIVQKCCHCESQQLRRQRLQDTTFDAFAAAIALQPTGYTPSLFS